MTGIFVGYREADAKPWALLLRTELAAGFGDERVFLDKDSLHAGNWRDQIRTALASCRVMLVVMGRQWLTITDEQGRRRLDNPDDVHRYEIATALARGDVVVIPIRVDGAAQLRAQDLPQDIQSLADHQVRELSDNHERRRVDLDLLFDDIERVTGLTARRPRGGVSALRGFLGWMRFALIQLLIAGAASVALLVFLDVGMGWTLDGAERVFLVAFVLVMTIVGGRVRRLRGRRQHEQ